MQLSKSQLSKNLYLCKIFPEEHISLQYLFHEKFRHIFGRKKIFGQNARNVCSDVIPKVKIVQKFPQNLIWTKYANVQNIAGDRNFH